MADLVNGSDGDTPVRTDAQVALAFMLIDVNDRETAAGVVDAAIDDLRRADGGSRLADACWVRAWAAIYSRDFERVVELGEEGLAAAQRAGDVDTTARMHGVAAIGAGTLGDLAEARRHFGLELAGYLEIRDAMAEGLCRNNLGDIELVAGNLDAADASLEPAEAIARDLHIVELLATVLLDRANVADRRGDDRGALDRAAEALALVHRHNITRLLADALDASARGLFRVSPAVSATVNGAIANALAAGSRLGILETRLHAENEARLRDALGPDEFTRCEEVGRRLAMYQLLALVNTCAESLTTSAG